MGEEEGEGKGEDDDDGWMDGWMALAAADANIAHVCRTLLYTLVTLISGQR